MGLSMGTQDFGTSGQYFNTVGQIYLDDKFTNHMDTNDFNINNMPIFPYISTLNRQSHNMMNQLSQQQDLNARPTRTASSPCRSTKPCRPPWRCPPRKKVVMRRSFCSTGHLPRASKSRCPAKAVRSYKRTTTWKNRSTA